jgi:hypothetical protein
MNLKVFDDQYFLYFTDPFGLTIDIIKKMKTAILKLIILICWIFYFCSCSEYTDSLSQKQNSIVRINVTQLVESIAKNVSDKGPVAWLFYFEDSPDFFMASEGQLKFENKESAAIFINNTLIHSISKIKLQWNTIRIDPLTRKLAGIGSFFHEDIVSSDGKKVHVDGYFTGIAHLTSHGWKLRNAHWSVLSSH